MSTLNCTELNLLLDNEGSVIAFQEKDQSWAGALAFSTEEKAVEFVKASHLEVAEVAAIDLGLPVDPPLETRVRDEGEGVGNASADCSLQLSNDARFVGRSAVIAGGSTSSQ